MIQYLPAGFLIAFATCLVLLRILEPFANRWGLIDYPGGRKTHDNPTPLVGGIAMYAAFYIAAAVSGADLLTDTPLLVGASILLAFGVWDDRRERSARLRFAVQIVAVSLMAAWAGIKLDDFGYLLSPSWELSLGVFAVPVTLFSAVGVINALNMVDGVDGLAASLVLVAVAALGVVAGFGSRMDALGIVLVLAGVVLAFLLRNLRRGGRALVFMGDAGSMFLGFVLACLLVQFSQGGDRLMEPVTALWIFALPLFDAVATTIRRPLCGRSPFACDRGHFHHLLLAAGLGPKRTLALVVVLAIVAAAVGLTGQFLGVAEHWMFLGFMSLFALHFWVVSNSWKRRRFLNRPLVLYAGSSA